MREAGEGTYRGKTSGNKTPYCKEYLPGEGAEDGSIAAVRSDCRVVKKEFLDTGQSTKPLTWIGHNQLWPTSFLESNCGAFKTPSAAIDHCWIRLSGSELPRHLVVFAGLLCVLYCLPRLSNAAYAVTSELCAGFLMHPAVSAASGLKCDSSAHCDSCQSSICVS